MELWRVEMYYSFLLELKEKEKEEYERLNKEISGKKISPSNYKIPQNIKNKFKL